MRIALLLSGQPRFVKEVAPIILANVIGDYNVDTFCHFWFDDKLQSEPYKYGECNKGEWHKQRIPADAIDDAINAISKNKIWLEMSTTDDKEVKRIGKLVKLKGAIPLDAPVSGGCHRASTGNIAIFVGGERKSFEKILPALKTMGRKILHTGELGSASILKVITNFLASTHLAALGEAWAVAKKSNLDMNKTFKGIKVSSGNSFVHETESQVILNGSYNINFTMDLVEKDMTLFNDLSKELNIPMEISPLVLNIFKDAHKKYGSRAWSSMVVKRLEDNCKINFRADGYPEELVDNEKEEKGYEI